MTTIACDCIWKVTAGLIWALIISNGPALIIAWILNAYGNSKRISAFCLVMNAFMIIGWYQDQSSNLTELISVLTFTNALALGIAWFFELCQQRNKTAEEVKKNGVDAHNAAKEYKI